MSTGQCHLHHLCVVSSVFLIKFKKNLVFTFEQFRSNTKQTTLFEIYERQTRKKKYDRQFYNFICLKVAKKP